jgi:hypothetical protein
MKRTLLAGIAGLSSIGAVQAEGLYYVGSESKDSIPLKWVVGADLTYDDNVNPVAAAGGGSGTSVNPYVGLSFLSAGAQTTWDVFARLGMIYYFDAPTGTPDSFGQARLAANLTHRFNERLRFSSRNFISYELEPNYAFGFANSRQVGEYLYWQTDNSLGYRWTERLATYTGIQLTGLNYDSSVPNADRFTTTLYHQFRYQLSPQSVLTAEYRYAQTDGDALASDATDHFILAGIEHRFSPTTILIARAGAQLHQVDSVGASDGSSPYAELALNSQINTAFGVKAFLRYGLENYDTIRAVGVPGDLYEFDSRATLRIGVSGQYAISQKLSLYGGVDYIPTMFDDGRRRAGTGALTVSDLSEDLINAYVGVSMRFTDYLKGSITYNYTESNSDLLDNTYDRNRITVGINAEF